MVGHLHPACVHLPVAWLSLASAACQPSPASEAPAPPAERPGAAVAQPAISAAPAVAAARPEPAAGRVIRADDGALRRRRGAELAVEAGMELRVGDSLEVDSGLLHAVLRDKTQIRLASGGRLRLVALVGDAEDRRGHLDLAAGSLRIDAAAGAVPGEDHMEVTLPRAVLEAAEAEVWIDLDADGVCVLAGAVDIDFASGRHKHLAQGRCHKGVAKGKAKPWKLNKRQLAKRMAAAGLGDPGAPP